MPYTIYDLAKECDVSVATVSRVINNVPTVKAKTREKILAVMKMRNYVPNALARGMNKMSMKLIGVLVNDVGDSFCSKIINGIETECRKNKYKIFISSTNFDPVIEKEAIELMVQNQVDGIIIAGSRPLQDVNADYLREVSKNIPLVLINGILGDYDNIYTIQSDEQTATREALDIILCKNYYKEVFVIGPDYYQTSKIKIGQCSEVCKKYNVIFTDKNIISCEYGFEEGKKAAEKFLQIKREHPVLVFCTQDKIAAGFNYVLTEHNVNRPDEVGLFCFSNTDFAEYVYPPMTAVNQQMNVMGQMAAQLFINLKQNIAPTSHIIHSPFVFTKRASTK